MTKEEMIEFLNKHNVASYSELRTWHLTRLVDSVDFVKAELKATNAK